MTNRRFDGRVAVITGAGRGLGREYARLLASQGAKVLVNDSGASVKGEGSDSGPAEQVVQEIKSSGGHARACTDSVATPEGGKAIIDAALEHFGRIDILIHNAGNVRYGSLQEITQEDFDAVVDFVGGFITSGKPVGIVCHGAWTLLEAGVARGRSLPSYATTRAVRQTGASILDGEVVSPQELRAFYRTIAEEFARLARPHALASAASASGAVT